ncbi:MAG: 6-phospho-3-hexuloisomerase [Clostridia bacterium]|nr:6-phospho-3-hexuloisomerase [Clostridia bacterium]
MSIVDTLARITDELREVSAGLDEAQLRTLKRAIVEADRVFVAGTGRSLLMIRGLAMRLMQMGFTAYVVGETTTPAIGPGDLLVIASGSGETATMVVCAEKCKRFGARLALITIHPDAPIGRLADLVVQVHTSSSKGGATAAKSFQPGGNAFEQSVLLIGDAVMMDIADTADVDAQNAALMGRHANLE